jgi:DNA-binding transcriptional ArsR family regulator
MINEGNILELETRKKIFNFISEYPGIHIREISRKTNIAFSTLRHHLNYLEKHDLAVRKNDGRYYRYYAKDKIGRKDKKILDFLRQDTPRAIILLLFAYVECSLIEISDNLEKDPSTISYHLEKMQKMGIIEQVFIDKGLISKKEFNLVIKRNRVTNETVYMLKDYGFLYNLLIRYKDNLFDNITVDTIVSYVDEFLKEGRPEKILSPKDSVDAIAEAIFELFPPSFCA